MALIDDWVTDLAAQLGVPADAVDVRTLLDLARDAAHQVDRPAAPLTTYLVGLAAGLRGGGTEAVATAVATAQRAAAAWTPPADAG